MDKVEASKYKISIPFGAFLTANSILIAADFILLQLWFSFLSLQPETILTQVPTQVPTQVLQSIRIGTIFVSYFVVVSIVSMIIAILDRIEIKVKGRPIILFLFSLLFTMCFVFQSIVTLAIKFFKKLPQGFTFYGDSNIVGVYILLGIALVVTIWAILWPECWDKLFWSFKKHINYLMLAILGILIGITGGIFIIAEQYICYGTIIGWALIAIGIVLVASISACCYCMENCQCETK